MRTSPSEFRRPAFGIFLLLLAGALSLVPATYATDTIWTNTGIITLPPRIDAINVDNSGLISIFTDLPFETSNTQNFTNSGTIQAEPGWFFNNAPTTIGERGLMASFVNQSGGVIEALDAPQTLFIIGLPGGATFPSYLWVSATNIINRGTLSVGAGGWLKLAGTNVNLARGGVEVTAIIPVGSDNVGSNYFPEAGISDIYWGATNIALPPGVPTRGIWDGTYATTPGHDITVAGGFGGQQRFAFQMFAAFADSYGTTNGFIAVTVTNLVGLTNLPSPPTVTNLQETNILIETILVPTNVTKQAVFVGSSDPSVLGANIYWHNSSSPTNVFKTAEVEMIFISPNNVSGGTEANYIYVYDSLASEVGRGVLANVSSPQNLTTYRPTNYIVSRLQLGKFGFGFTGDGYPDRNYLWAPSYSNNVVAADYSAYGAFVANIPALPPLNPYGTYTNLSGRVQIYADSLDMTRTRLRGQGEVTVNARHLVGSSNAIVDCPNLAFNLASTNNNLVFANLANTSVQRLEGDLYLYSLVWQNQETLYSENWNITTNFDTNGVVTSLDATYSPATNSVELNLAASLINGENLATSLPVYVWDLRLLNPNVTVSDNMNVVHTFFTDASALTINGGITFTDGSWRTTLGYTTFPGLQDFISTNIPNLLNFTNNGTFSIPSSCHFGNDRPTPLESFVNAGSIDSYSINVSSTYFRNSGSLSGGGAMRIIAGQADLTGGSSSTRNTFITSDSLRMNGYRLTANGPLTFQVASLFTDAGTAGSTNFISLFNGVLVVNKPAAGDLLVTGMRSSLRAFSQTDHIWPGEDLGVSAAGFTNNLALGKLSFTGAVTQDPLAWFAGTGGKNALYVDQLDLTALGTFYADVLSIDPDFTLYYSSAKLSFNPPNAANGVPQTPEEYLDGQFNGRLRWVSSYTGIYSSVAVVLNGQTVLMNAALRNSRLIDSDGDGVPNYYDTTPLGGTTETPSGGSVVLNPSFLNPGAGAKTFGISWDAAANTAYQVEVATDLAKGDWQVLTTFTNTATIGKKATFTDPAAAQTGQRFYRIRLQP
jgi:hypothetical protein